MRFRSSQHEQKVMQSLRNLSLNNQIKLDLRYAPGVLSAVDDYWAKELRKMHSVRNRSYTVRQLLLYNRDQEKTVVDVYSCHYPTISNAFRYIELSGEFFKLPTYLSDNHGRAAVCDRCPNQLECLNDSKRMIDGYTFENAQTLDVKIEGSKDPRYVDFFE